MTMSRMECVFVGCLLLAGVVVAKPSVDGTSRSPNFLVLLTDDQRTDTLSVYNSDCSIQTPNLDRLAQEGIRFDHGFATSPICSVSRACILSGRYETNARMHQFQTPLPEDVFEQTYPMILGENGYYTGQLGKYGVGIRPEEKKRYDVFEAQERQGPAFREYKGRKMHDAEWLTVKTEEFLERVPKGKPFCLQVNYKEPHPSAGVAPEDAGVLAGHDYPRGPQDTPEAFARLPEFVQKGYGRLCYTEMYNKGGDHNSYMRKYHEKILSVDRSVGQIMQMLHQRGLAENTVVVFLSDHGTHFGEKQLAAKWTPYEQSLRIPFIIHDPRPGARKGGISDEMVFNIDVAPTLLDLAGVSVPDEMDGTSLVPLISDARPLTSENWRDHFFYENFCSPSGVRAYIPRNVGVRTTSMKYVRWTDMEPAIEELYDLRNDPMEMKNLASNPEYREQFAQLRAQYDAWREANPSTYVYDSYGVGFRAQAGAPEIDWERFREAKPEIYEKIKVQVEKLGVTWERAMNDPDVRAKICSRVGYWY